MGLKPTAVSVTTEEKYFSTELCSFGGYKEKWLLPHHHFRIEREYCGNEMLCESSWKNASLISGRENVCEDMCIGMFAREREQSGCAGSQAWGNGRREKSAKGRCWRVTWEQKMGVVCQINGKARCVAVHSRPLPILDTKTVPFEKDVKASTKRPVITPSPANTIALPMEKECGSSKTRIPMS